MYLFLSTIAHFFSEGKHRNAHFKYIKHFLGQRNIFSVKARYKFKASVFSINDCFFKEKLCF